MLVLTVIIAALILVLIFILSENYLYSSSLKNICRKMDPIYNKIKPTKFHKKILLQTYHDKRKIPSKVYRNIKKYAADYEHIIYDDDDCIKFLTENYNKIVVNRFKSLSMGAHKADLFRYCWLYKNGGVYLDIKIILVKPLNKIFTNYNCLYTCNAYDRSMFKSRGIFQGIISAPPKSYIFKQLINSILVTSDLQLKLDTLTFTKDFYKALKRYRKPYKLLNEICDNRLNSDLKADRYGKKCAIYDTSTIDQLCPNNRSFVVRYTDYPW